MKHFCRLNLLCSHYKLLLLTCNVAPYYISALVCLDVCGARMVNFVMYVVQVHVCGSVREWYLRSLACSTFHVYCSPSIACCSYVFETIQPMHP